MINYSLSPVNSSNFEKEIMCIMSDELNALWDIIEPVIERNTPTDKKVLIQNTQYIKSNKQTLQVTFLNTTPYAIYVEWLDGNGNKTVNTVKSFHKWPPRDESTVFYTWEWVGFMSRSFDEVIAKYN